VVVTVRDPVATVSSWRRLGDLSADPVPAFGKLYARLGLPFGPGAERAILGVWRERLTDEEGPASAS
jgi:hypothetical protein